MGGWRVGRLLAPRKRIADFGIDTHVLMGSSPAERQSHERGHRMALPSFAEPAEHLLSTHD
jgi:hypothetical protein